jgi:hypothetical protein
VRQLAGWLDADCQAFLPKLLLVELSQLLVALLDLRLHGGVGVVHDWVALGIELCQSLCRIRLQGGFFRAFVLVPVPWASLTTVALMLVTSLRVVVEFFQR